VLLDPNPWDVRVLCSQTGSTPSTILTKKPFSCLPTVWVLRVLRLPHHSSTPAILREALL
jgi:hypothetical protein